MLTQRLRANREILTIECSKPTVFRIMWSDLNGKQVKVGVDAEASANIQRHYQDETIRGLPWTCKPNGFIEVEARSSGTFQCQINEVKNNMFDITLQAPDSFLYEFIVESGIELCW